LITGSKDGSRHTGEQAVRWWQVHLYRTSSNGGRQTGEQAVRIMAGRTGENAVRMVAGRSRGQEVSMAAWNSVRTVVIPKQTKKMSERVETLFTFILLHICIVCIQLQKLLQSAIQLCW
jgi:hypothetical protein